MSVFSPFCNVVLHRTVTLAIVVVRPRYIHSFRVGASITAKSNGTNILVFLKQDSFCLYIWHRFVGHSKLNVITPIFSFALALSHSVKAKVPNDLHFNRQF